MTAPDVECDGHPGLVGEWRAVVLGIIDRLAPLLEKIKAEPAGPIAASTCAACPVCALIAALRGERPELAVRLAEQATGLLSVLRAALEEGDPAAAAATRPPTEPDHARSTNGRRVQYITVERR